MHVHFTSYDFYIYSLFVIIDLPAVLKLPMKITFLSVYMAECWHHKPLITIIIMLQQQSTE